MRQGRAVSNGIADTGAMMPQENLAHRTLAQTSDAKEGEYGNRVECGGLL
jgi:hypothetical protein